MRNEMDLGDVVRIIGFSLIALSLWSAGADLFGCFAGVFGVSMVVAARQ